MILKRMIYFIVNNNLHYIWSRAILEKISKINTEEDFSLIRFEPSALTMAEHDDIYENVYRSQGFFTSFWQLLNPIYMYKVKQNIKRIIFKKDDIVFLFTEYEIGNHYIVKRAKRKGAKVFIIDEGIGTYIINNYPYVFRGSSLKQRIIDYIIRYAIGFYDSRRLTGTNLLYFPRLDDKYYDGYILFYNFPLERSMPKVYVRFPGLKEELKNRDSNSILILGQGLNDFYLDDKEYIDSLLAILEVAAKSFRYVYFKFHHCEIKYLDRPEFKKLRKRLKELEIKIIDFDKPVAVENMISTLDHRPKFVVSYFSTALLNLFAVGCQPIFACHLLEKKCVDFEVVRTLLESVNYNFVSCYSDITPQYSSALTLDKIYTLDFTFQDFYKGLAYEKG